MDLDEWEHVTCVKTVNLSYEGTRSGLKGYVAVGTNYNYSEDITSKGRVSFKRLISAYFYSSLLLLIILVKIKF